jgi:hypothetical protein
VSPRRIVADLDTSTLADLDPEARLDLTDTDPRWQALTNHERAVIAVAQCSRVIGQCAGFVDVPYRRQVADALRDVAARFELGVGR